MATVTQYWAPTAGHTGLYQAAGTVEWFWQLGDNNYFWSYAIRPRQANMQTEITRQWTTSDNDLVQVEHFLLTVSNPSGKNFRPFGINGGLLQFTAIKVEEP